MTLPISCRWLLVMVALGEAEAFRRPSKHKAEKAEPGTVPVAPTNFGGIFVDGRPGHKYDTSWMHKVKQLSMEEAGLTCHNVTCYGAMVPKLPASFVASLEKLKADLPQTKTHKYSFQGSLYKHGIDRTRLRRKWAEDFAKAHFGDNDVFIQSDLRPPDQPEYVPLGSYDHTLDSLREKTRSLKSEERPYHFESGDSSVKFDPSYYATMAQSEYSLAPGAVGAWSMRFYEAIAAGSIPVINATESDYRGSAKYYNQLGYTYFTTAQVVNMTLSAAEMKSITDKNYELFLRYQTWVHGDNVPPEYNEEYGGGCSTCKQCLYCF